MLIFELLLLLFPSSAEANPPIPLGGLSGCKVTTKTHLYPNFAIYIYNA